jgi:hypothetical protein
MDFSSWLANDQSPLVKRTLSGTVSLNPAFAPILEVAGIGAFDRFADRFYTSGDSLPCSLMVSSKLSDATCAEVNPHEDSWTTHEMLASVSGEVFRSSASLGFTTQLGYFGGFRKPSDNSFNKYFRYPARRYIVILRFPSDRPWARIEVSQSNEGDSHPTRLTVAKNAGNSSSTYRYLVGPVPAKAKIKVCYHWPGMTDPNIELPCG